MIYRLNRKLLIVLKLILCLIIGTFIWFHLKINKYETDYRKVESFLTKEMKFLNKSKFSDNSSHIRVINKLKEKIELINSKQEVLNYQTFGPLMANHLVILIQVHNRVEYLSALVESLEQTKGINEVLLVFSHDVFDPQINSVVTSIRFCKVIQMFYPNSLQLNPNSFPGESADDCPRDIGRKEAVRMGCTNALSADTYGHYREAKYTQTKHHWWWKANSALHRLNITRTHSGHFMFLEEDHYLAPDAIHVWNQMKAYISSNNYQILTLGSYSRSVDFAKYGDKIESNNWISSRHNMGFIFNRNVWNQIKNCSKSFCTYDDYNWDWSLQYVSEKCLKSPLITLFVVIPRVYHTGECGVHHKRKDCNNLKIVANIRNAFKSSQSYLFPNKLILKNGIKRTFRMPKANGGWSDPRDHQLCLNLTQLDFR